jgi:hypothetical protein
MSGRLLAREDGVGKAASPVPPSAAKHPALASGMEEAGGTGLQARVKHCQEINGLYSLASLTLPFPLN